MTFQLSTHFGDYILDKKNGRHYGTCSHCTKSVKLRPSPGQAEQSVREHLRDVHKIKEPKRDVRQSMRWATYG